MAKNTMLLYGKNSVLERLKATPATIRKVFLAEGFDLSAVRGPLKEHGIEYECMNARELSKIKGAKDLQGIVARVEKFRYAPFSELVETESGEPPTLVFLDRVNDPQNLGVIIRIAACFGRTALIIPKFHACEVNETVLHVASGGENYVPISLVSNLSSSIIAAKKRGYWIMGAVVDNDAQDIGTLSLPFPLALVLGSEGEGVRYGVEKHLDIKARIPMDGAPLSFNVSMASAILLYEINRQRKEPSS
ncbi:MAG: 23S rRNA (guanosine(2251)-2'-O)-methyltransferase RlmB [Candidatus Omnitrophica bacterium]|nr:23S rRNA (guanosine(2251)-2'-O)-methyltransferase RlmB [Candidatus Omnitrophota bacterium]